jgi:hypothetical protein
MFCPCCGSPIDERGDALICLRTGVDFSVNVSKELRAFVDSPPSETSFPVKQSRWGGNWWCPADGTRLSEHDGVVDCARCTRLLPGRVLYQLIEFNWHPKADAEG